MFQSRITCQERKEYVHLLETDPEAAARFKIRFDRTDQWFLEEVKAAYENHDDHRHPKNAWCNDDIECQMEYDVAHGKYRQDP